MQIQQIELAMIKANKANPRVIRDDKFHKLVNSILCLPKMLELRPIVGDKYTVLGGNQRLRALQYIESMEVTELLSRLQNCPDYGKKAKRNKNNLNSIGLAGLISVSFRMLKPMN